MVGCIFQQAEIKKTAEVIANVFLKIFRTEWSSDFKTKYKNKFTRGKLAAQGASGLKPLIQHCQLII